MQNIGGTTEDVARAIVDSLGSAEGVGAQDGAVWPAGALAGALQVRKLHIGRPHLVPPLLGISDVDSPGTPSARNLLAAL